MAQFRFLSINGRQLVNFGANDFSFWLRVNETLLFQSGFVSLALKGTFEKQYFIVSEPKGEVISSKIDRLAAIYISKLNF